jgi:hypothetical protein
MMMVAVPVQREHGDGLLRESVRKERVQRAAIVNCGEVADNPSDIPVGLTWS